MIRHVVMWKIKDEAFGKSKQEICLQIQKELEELLPKIPAIKELQVSFNHPDCPQDNYDVVLDTVFDSVADLSAYQQHPEHQKVASFIKQVVVGRACIDYTI
jgi:hypothetical protein